MTGTYLKACKPSGVGSVGMRVWPQGTVRHDRRANNQTAKDSTQFDERLMDMVRVQSDNLE
jgi:hypothetical protein